VVCGREGCGYFIQASSLARQLDPQCQINSFSDSEWRTELSKLQLEFNRYDHKTSPIVYSIDPITNSKHWIGGYDAFSMLNSQ
jgi:hypothetical protein